MICTNTGSSCRNYDTDASQQSAPKEAKPEASSEGEERKRRKRREERKRRKRHEERKRRKRRKRRKAHNGELEKVSTREEERNRLSQGYWAMDADDNGEESEFEILPPTEAIQMLQTQMRSLMRKLDQRDREIHELQQAVVQLKASMDFLHELEQYKSLEKA